MSVIALLILMLVVLLGTAGQLSLKHAFNNSSTASTPFRNLLVSPYFWIWFISYLIVTVLWLFVLQKMPLNQAFPSLGLTYAFVPLASHYFLKEKVFLNQWLGIVIILSGVILVLHR